MADKPDETPRKTATIPKLPNKPAGDGAVKPPPRPTTKGDAVPAEVDDGWRDKSRVVNVPPAKKPARDVSVAPLPGVGDATDVNVGRKAFDDAAGSYAVQLRDVMLEIGFGAPEPVKEWLERGRGTLRALVAMAETAQLSDHARSFGHVAGMVDAALAQATPLTETDRAELVRAYQPVIALGARVGPLEAERDRRQRVIIEALLAQVDGVEQPVLDGIRAANLESIDVLATSNPGVMATNAYVRLDVATAIVKKMVAYRAERRGVLSAANRSDERNRLERQAAELRGRHDSLMQVSLEWSDEARAQKRVFRHQRERMFQRVRLMLARLGEVDLVDQLAPMAYADRIATIERFLGSRVEEKKPMPTFARDEVIKKVLQGERLDRTDLRGLDLSKSRLVKAMLDRADMEGVNLDAAELSESSLKRTNLRGAYLVGADLSEANLENADLEGANLERANLAGANLTRANLEGANLTAANLNGARLAYAQLTSARLGTAYLPECSLAHAELVDAYLGQVIGDRASLEGANLTGANLDGALFPGANFDGAKLGSSQIRDANFNAASLLKADLSGADLSGANFADTDLRAAVFTQATLAGTRLTGAKAAGLVGTGTPTTGVEVEWLDLSVAGDGSQRVENGAIPTILAKGAMAHAPAAAPAPVIATPPPAAAKPAPAPADDGRRYFGRGDVIRNATLQFDTGVRVQLDSLFENCTLQLADKTDVVVGAAGVLADCQIVGPGSLTIHGKFFEKKSPGIVGARDLVVSANAAVVSTIAQPASGTRFAFESGCQLRVKIVTDGTEVKK